MAVAARAGIEPTAQGRYETEVAEPHLTLRTAGVEPDSIMLHVGESACIAYITSRCHVSPSAHFHQHPLCLLLSADETGISMNRMVCVSNAFLLLPGLFRMHSRMDTSELALCATGTSFTFSVAHIIYSTAGKMDLTATRTPTQSNCFCLSSSTRCLMPLQ